MQQKIEKIDLSQNIVLRRETTEDKLGVLDVLAVLDGKEKCNIEIQRSDKENMLERLLFYWSKLYTKQLNIGEDYKELEKVIVVLIADFNLKGLEELNYHSTWKIMETNESKKIILTDKFEIDIIELPKIIEKETENDKLLDWLYFLENPESERVVSHMKENKELKEAVDKLCILSEDKKMQRIAELRKKAIMDEKATYAKGITEGKKEGREQGLQQGRQEGLEQGMQLGLEKGRAEERKVQNLETAKKMLMKNIDIEIIIEITGLSKEEIERIKEEL